MQWNLYIHAQIAVTAAYGSGPWPEPRQRTLSLFRPDAQVP